MAMLSSTLRNLKFMKNKAPETKDSEDKTFSYYACKNIVMKFSSANSKIRDFKQQKDAFDNSSKFY